MNPSGDILAFSGSLRANSLNHQLVEVVSSELESRGKSVTIVRLTDFDLPLYNPDEASGGIPKGAHFLKQRFLQHRGLLIASPEYNGFMTGALKNAIDWVSHPDEGRDALHCFKDKVGAIMSAAPGRMGGIRGLPSLRELLAGVGVHVVAQALAVPEASSALDTRAGRLTHPRSQALMERMVDQIVSLLGT